MRHRTDPLPVPPVQEKTVVALSRVRVLRPHRTASHRGIPAQAEVGGNEPASGIGRSKVRQGYGVGSMKHVGERVHRDGKRP